ncbi:MAG TPA: universal stress protein [Acidimicrobiales bacterium]|jgi:nucleotide-binding universal stress UspA family protein|nr:universal stress protein [Acidimicrobiales bacterium]
MAYRQIVVGTDGSDTATGAVREAAALAAALGAKLTVVTAYAHDPATDRAAADAPDEVRWRVTDAAEANERARQGSDVARGAGATNVDVYVEAGEPSAVVIEAAELRRADCIVVGSKGMTGAKRFLLGSVPNKISHHAPCDVLIVHTAP